MEVGIESLVLDPFKLRVRYDDGKISQLKGSIIQVGLLSPLKVWPCEGKFWVVDGNYRLIALRQLGWSKIPVETLPEDTSFKQALLVAAISNWHRAGFTFMDKARTVQRLLEAGLTDIEICARLELPLEKGKPGRLFRYYREFEEFVSEQAKGILEPRFHGITRRHAEALVMLRDYPDKQRELAERIVAEHLTCPEALREADKILHPEKYVRQPKPWTCDCCGEEQPPEEAKTAVVMCPLCYADFEIWKHDRMKAENEGVAEPT